MEPTVFGRVIVADEDGTLTAVTLQIEGINSFPTIYFNVFSQFPPCVVLQHIVVERSVPTQRGLRRLRYARQVLRLRTNLCRGEAEGFRPLADDVRIIVGAHHQRVLGVKLQVRQHVGIVVDKNQVLHIVIDADLPLCGASSLVPVYRRAIRRDVRSLQLDRSRAVQVGCIEDGIFQFIRSLEDDLSKRIADYIGTLIGISTAFPYEVDFTP